MRWELHSRMLGGPRLMRTLTVGFVRSILENVSQGLVASTYMTLMGISAMEQPVVFASTILSVICVTKRSLDIVAITRQIYSLGKRRGLAMLMLIPAICMLLCSFYIASKVSSMKFYPKEGLVHVIS